MPKDSLPVVWDIPPHTSAKHEMLRRYLGAWFGIFGHSQHQTRANFIDGFAGPGVYESGEPGSPIIAVRTLLEHTAFDSMSTTFNFLLNENDEERAAVLTTEVEELRRTVGGWPENVKVQVTNENFFDLGEEILGAMQPGQSLAPTFFFIDPFGYKDLPLDLIRRLLHARGCELLFYFDFNSVNRFGTAHVVDPALTEYFGTDAFQHAPPSGDPGRAAYFHDLFEDQLRSECGLTFIQSFEMIRSSGHTGYYLFFGTRNFTAFDKMKQAMWAIDPSGQYRFSDRYADEDVLFQADVDTTLLRREMLREFAGRDVGIEDLTEWVVINTPFASTHVKRASLKVLEDDGQIEIASSPRKRRGTYPDGTVLRFPVTPHP